MRNMIYGILTAGLACMLWFILATCTGCRTAKVQQAVVSAVRSDSTIATREGQKVTTHTDKRDTAVGISGGVIEHTGTKDTTIRIGNLTLTTYTNAKGERKTRCAADSMTIVIRNLLVERKELYAWRDSVVSAKGTEQHVTKSVVQADAGWLATARRVSWLVVAFVCGVVFGRFVFPWLKKMAIWT